MENNISEVNPLNFKIEATSSNIININESQIDRNQIKVYTPKTVGERMKAYRARKKLEKAKKAKPKTSTERVREFRDRKRQLNSNQSNSQLRFEINFAMVFTPEQDAFILMAHFRSATRQSNGTWLYSLQSCCNQYLEAFPDEVINYDVFSNHKRRLVHRFETKNCICKGKSTGRPTVLTKEVLHDLKDRMVASPRQPVKKLAEQTGLSIGSCHKALNIGNLRELQREGKKDSSTVIKNEAIKRPRKEIVSSTSDGSTIDAADFPSTSKSKEEVTEICGESALKRLRQENPDMCFKESEITITEEFKEEEIKIKDEPIEYDESAMESTPRPETVFLEIKTEPNDIDTNIENEKDILSNTIKTEFVDTNTLSEIKTEKNF